MKVGKLAVDIDTQDEGSGVQSVDIFYQISEGNGKSLIANLDQERREELNDLGRVWNVERSC